ncbi:MAG: hypothetical protein WA434_13820, partial [Candidatus Acidiferrales bacterium]
IAAGKRAIELDPLSAAATQRLGLAYYFARRFEAAIEQLRKGMAMSPGSQLYHPMIADTYAYAGQPEETVEECAKALAGREGLPPIRLMVAATYAKIGKIAEARAILNEDKKAWSAGSAISFYIAAVHARLGEKDVAFEWLEKAFQDRIGLLIHLKTMPLVDALHGDPRFDALVKRIGIPE